VTASRTTTARASGSAAAAEPVARPPAPPARSRAESVAHEIERRILDAALPHGSRLGTKAELQRAYGVAAGTLNEAVRLLQTRGLVAAKPGPGGGLVVLEPSSDVHLSHLVLRLREDGGASADCLAVRNALEERVALDAAAACTPADVAELQALLDEMDRRRADPREFLRANWALHRKLAQIGPNAVLRAIYVTLLDAIEREIEAVGSDATFEPAANLKLHQRLVDAVASGDAARVRRAVRRHNPEARRSPVAGNGRA